MLASHMPCSQVVSQTPRPIKNVESQNRCSFLHCWSLVPVAQALADQMLCNQVVLRSWKKCYTHLRSVVLETRLKSVVVVLPMPFTTVTCARPAIVCVGHLVKSSEWTCKFYNKNGNLLLENPCNRMNRGPCNMRTSSMSCSPPRNRFLFCASVAWPETFVSPIYVRIHMYSSIHVL